MAGPSGEDAFAARLRGFGPLGVLSILGVLAGNFLFAPMSALLALLWVKHSHTPWREIGYVRPVSWLKDAAIGIGFGAAFKLLMKAIVMPLLGAPPINAAYQHLAGNTGALPGMLFVVVIVAGFGEETLFRGYLFERLGKLFGTGPGAKAWIVLLTSALFAAAHYPDQGLPGVLQAAVVGLVFGATFAVTGRIFMLMVAHAAFDVVAVAIIYLGLESAVARLVYG